MCTIRHWSVWLALLVTLFHTRPLVAQQTAMQRHAERVAALVRTSNPELDELRSIVAWTEARARAAGFGPAVALSFEIEEVPGGLNVALSGSSRVQLSKEFLPSGLRSAQRSLSDAEVRQSRILFETAEQRLAAQTHALLVQALGSTRIASRLAAEDSLWAAAEDALRSRFAVGEARYVDVLRLRTERLRVRADLAEVAAEARVSRARLFSLVADTAARLVAVTLDSMSVEAGLPALMLPGVLHDPDSLVAQSAAIRLAAGTVAQSQAASRVAQAHRRPAFAAMIGAQRFEDQTGTFAVGPVLGGSISLPFTSRAFGNAAQAAELGVSAARFGEAATRRRMAANVRVVLEQYRAAEARIQVHESGLLLGAREERESALAAYRSGTLTLLELLDFERALARAEIALVQSRMDAAASVADLYTLLASSGVDEPRPLRAAGWSTEP